MNSTYNSGIRELVDNIKSVCTNAWLWGDANEYKIVTQAFLYKFLNDKFLYEVKKVHPQLNGYKDLEAINEGEYKKMLKFEIWNKAAHLNPPNLLSHLFSLQDSDDFAKVFDETLNDIAILNNNVFSVHTAWNTDIRLFEEWLIKDSIKDSSKRNDFAKKIINKLSESKINFDEIFNEWFDFFSTIFEYMIKDYNKDSWVYAEYFTPHSIAKLMAEILVWEWDHKSSKVYDPSAGSGTLLMNIANKIGVDRCTIYSQDISYKSSNLLRLNLILNNLTHSINNIVQWDTIIDNRHTEKMDFIVSNPPFKMDFSDSRDEVETLPNASERFFAWVPKILKKKKDWMAIYTLFFQHIMYSLSTNWKAAIVVPTWFLTAWSGIEKKIRERLIEEKMLKGVVSMPSNIFANTGTNVSIIFIDKQNKDNKVVLMDASNLWRKVKDWKNQKTVLSTKDEQHIIDGFNTLKPVEDLSVVIDYNDIKEKDYSFSAGQYFDIKIEYIDITKEEFEEKMNSYQENLWELFKDSKKLEDEILSNIKGLKYD